MNKQERAEIKTIILEQIESLSEQVPTAGNAAGGKLRLERLGAALRRIEAENFGEFFKCEKPIQVSRLLAHQESILCDYCFKNKANQP